MSRTLVCFLTSLAMNDTDLQVLFFLKHECNLSEDGQEKVLGFCEDGGWNVKRKSHSSSGEL